VYLDGKNVFQPDLVFINEVNKSIITNRGIEGTPDLVLEVISPSNIFTDRNIKKKVYHQIGVKEFWIVDPANKTLEVYLRDQKDPDIPHLFLIEEGEVRSTVLTDLSFDLKLIF
jgi:Uma2 family endonuclease